MKKILILPCLMISAFSFAQQLNADDVPSTITSNSGHPVHYNTTELKNYTLSGSLVTACDSGSTTLSVTGACTYDWSTDSLGANIVSSSSDLTTPTLYNNTTYYLSVNEPVNPVTAPLPAQSSPYSGNVRGYWFTAQSDFTMTALWVPTDASTGTTNIAVVRFNSGVPPLYSTTTNDFTLLGLWQQALDDTIYVCIPVQTGDIIGILGDRGDINSYAPAPGTTTIDGNTTTITRLGMQFPLATTAPQDLWQESGGSISRVFFAYSTTYSSTISPVNITVPQSFYSSSNMEICQGDSTLLYGNYYSTPGTYSDSLMTVYGCDSVYETNLSYYMVDATGTQNGLTLSANANGATYQWIDCGNGNTPLTGETNQSYTVTANGSYAVVVNDGTCSDTSQCWTINDVGLAQLEDGSLQIYPNPVTDIVRISTDINLSDAKIELLDIAGKLVMEKSNLNGNMIELDLSALTAGTYTVRLISTNSIYLARIVRK